MDLFHHLFWKTTFGYSWHRHIKYRACGVFIIQLTNISGWAFLRWQLVYCARWKACHWLLGVKFHSWQWRHRCYSSKIDNSYTQHRTKPQINSDTYGSKCNATTRDHRYAISKNSSNISCTVLPARWVRGTNSGASTFSVVSIGHFSGEYFVRIIVRSGDTSTTELSSIAWKTQIKECV